MDSESIRLNSQNQGLETYVTKMESIGKKIVSEAAGALGTGVQRVGTKNGANQAGREVGEVPNSSYDPTRDFHIATSAECDD